MMDTLGSNGLLPCKRDISLHHLALSIDALDVDVIFKEPPLE